ncbi:MAG: hypothetical protein LBT43_07020 [Prevotella sp.]|jgi:hypothetical protein|nr:hypothetical protein [Prevotella sp.]
MKTLNDYIAVYKEQLQKGDIQKAYAGLLRYMMSLKAHFSNKLSDSFSFGNISAGYMDYTYFPFFNDELREKKLRFGIVLNHEEVRFELWLMGQNAEVQKNYWNLLKLSPWNKTRTTMPEYSVLEVALIESPDFTDLNSLSLKIEKETLSFLKEIIGYLKAINT